MAYSDGSKQQKTPFVAARPETSIFPERVNTLPRHGRRRQQLFQGWQSSQVAAQVTRTEERDLRQALQRYEALATRRAHWGWTREWAEVSREMDAIRARLSPVPVQALLDRCERLCPQFEKLLVDIDARRDGARGSRIGARMRPAGAVTFQFGD